MNRRSTLSSGFTVSILAGTERDVFAQVELGARVDLVVNCETGTNQLFVAAAASVGTAVGYFLFNEKE